MNPIVTGAEPRPCTFKTLVNQIQSPTGMAVPLKLELMRAQVASMRLRGFGNAGRCEEANPCTHRGPGGGGGKKISTC